MDRAVALLRFLAGTKEGLSLSELARSLDLAPQTLQSLLRTLQRHGWVAQSERRGRYRLGPALAELHRLWRAGQDRAALAKPIVADLGRRVGEYVVLAEWTGGGLMPLLEAHPDRELAVRGETFLPDRIHTMATGKLLLGLLDEPRRREIVAALPLAHCGPNSVTDPEVLLRQLRSIRQSGVAVCVEEASDGVVALAVPVPSGSGRNPAALGTALPTARYSPKLRDQLIAELRDASAAIAEAWA